MYVRFLPTPNAKQNKGVMKSIDNVPYVKGKRQGYKIRTVRMFNSSVRLGLTGFRTDKVVMFCYHQC